MASPVKLSHIVLQTNKPRELREWYCRVLGAEIVHENDFISFISAMSSFSKPVRSRPNRTPTFRPAAAALRISFAARRGVATRLIMPRWRAVVA